MLGVALLGEEALRALRTRVGPNLVTAYVLVQGLFQRKVDIAMGTLVQRWLIWIPVLPLVCSETLVRVEALVTFGALVEAIRVLRMPDNVLL